MTSPWLRRQDASSHLESYRRIDPEDIRVRVTDILRQRGVLHSGDAMPTPTHSTGVGFEMPISEDRQEVLARYVEFDHYLDLAITQMADWVCTHRAGDLTTLIRVDREEDITQRVQRITLSCWYGTTVTQTTEDE